MEQEVQTQPTHIPAVIEVPDWLMAEQPVAKLTPKELRELTNQMYESFFETVLEKMTGGSMLRDILNEDHRQFDLGKYLSWIMRDPIRKARYYEAQEVQTEALIDQAYAIADSLDNPLEDVQRSSLRVDTRLKIAKVRHRDRYGDSKRLEIAKEREQPDLNALAGNLTKLLHKSTDGVYDGDDNVVDVE